MLEESADAFRRVLALQPNHPASITSLLYILNLLPATDPASIAEEHQRVATAAFVDPGPDPARNHGTGRIRIGYVSGDFCAHAVNYFFEPVLEHHDRSEFEIYCYSDVAKPDPVTGRLQESADHWRDFAGRSDDDLYDQVKTDGIDILVDLAGHTEHGRTAVFARKPASCQVSWLGFPNTSGLETMGYRVVDTFTAPVNEPFFGTEEALRLEHDFACFRPPAHAPPIQTAPLQKNGFVTLGSIHKLEKLNPGVIGLWASILRENPNTRLLLARDQLDQWQQRRLQKQFRQLGVDDQRLIMKQLSDPDQSFFELFADMDILLDTFPWSGHTLACCALWMGVPVVSLYGGSHAGRMVASVLDSLELNELIARNEASYSRIVAELCSTDSRLLDYRNKLRSRFENSPLRDEAGFTRAFEDQLKKLLE
jgi:predicted O-linked N-acetylglucosamine transferase (SPINDLY family)